jgi:hypothetical protein
MWGDKMTIQTAEILIKPNSLALQVSQMNGDKVRIRPGDASEFINIPEEEWRQFCRESCGESVEFRIGDYLIQRRNDSLWIKNLRSGHERGAPPKTWLEAWEELPKTIPDHE